MTVTILTGDCRDLLATLQPHSVQTCATSPPYWGLRDYSLPPTIWGGDSSCAHEWGDDLVDRSRATQGTTSGLTNDGATAMAANRFEKRSSFCTTCSAWRGQLGLEPDPRMYLRHMVDVFRAVRRVMRKDGTLWVNMGDSYTDGGRGDDIGSTLEGTRRSQRESRRTRNREGVKPFGLGKKQLIGMPWRLAFALQEDGWTLRSEIIWSKPNPMPESVTDRPTKAHEQLFLFGASSRYYYDQHAIREPVTGNSHLRGPRVPDGWDTAVDGATHRDLKGRYQKASGANSRSKVDRVPRSRKTRQNKAFMDATSAGLVASRNKRDVWTIATAPYPGAHFATFPPALIEPCILAGSSPQACERCGAPWRRIRGEPEVVAGRISGNVARKYRADHGGPERQTTSRRQAHAVPWEPTVSATVAWEPTCRCEGATGSARCVVLDPFGGVATTGLVADRLGRDAVLLELNPDYAAQGDARCAKARAHGFQTPMFEAGDL